MLGDGGGKVGGKKPGSGSSPGTETESTLSLDIPASRGGRWEEGRSAVESICAFCHSGQNGQRPSERRHSAQGRVGG